MTDLALAYVTESQPPIDVAIAELAWRQYGVVSLAQLIGLGLSGAGVRRRVKNGRLHRLHRGVFAVGHRLVPREGHWLAAVLACGPGAALSHRAAGAHWNLLASSRFATDVTVPAAGRRSRRGIDVHFSKHFDVTTHERIPCTSVPWTLLDIAEREPMRLVERAIGQAEVQKLFDLRAVHDVLRRANGRRGAPRLRSVLAIYTEPAITKSVMEDLLLELCTAYDIERPRVNQYVEGEQVDFHWPRQRVIVETDGEAWHGPLRRRRNDYRRSQRLERAGWHVLRFDWWQIVEEAAAVAETIARVLAEREGFEPSRRVNPAHAISNRAP